MGTAKKTKPQPAGDWFEDLVIAIQDAIADHVERGRFLEIAAETWDDTEAENASGGNVGDVEAPK